MTLGALSNIALRNGYLLVSGMFPSVSKANYGAKSLEKIFLSALFFTLNFGLST